MKKFLKFLFTECTFLPLIFIGCVTGSLFKDGKYSEAIIICGGFLWLMVAYALVKNIEEKP